MNIKTKLVFFTIILAILISAECQEQQTPTTDRRAKLVGNQNLQLKKQLKQKDVEIQRQKNLVIKCQQEMEAQQETYNQSAEGMIGIMKTLVERETQIQMLKAEIATLKGQ